MRSKKSPKKKRQERKQKLARLARLGLLPEPKKKAKQTPEIIVLADVHKSVNSTVQSVEASTLSAESNVLTQNDGNNLVSIKCPKKKAQVPRKKSKLLVQKRFESQEQRRTDEKRCRMQRAKLREALRKKRLNEDRCKSKTASQPTNSDHEDDVTALDCDSFDDLVPCTLCQKLMLQSKMQVDNSGMFCSIHCRSLSADMTKKTPQLVISNAVSLAPVTKTTKRAKKKSHAKKRLETEQNSARLGLLSEPKKKAKQTPEIIVLADVHKSVNSTVQSVEGPKKKAQVPRKKPKHVVQVARKGFKSQEHQRTDEKRCRMQRLDEDKRESKTETQPTISFKDVTALDSDSFDDLVPCTLCQKLMLPSKMQVDNSGMFCSIHCRSLSADMTKKTLQPVISNAVFLAPVTHSTQQHCFSYDEHDRQAKLDYNKTKKTLQPIIANVVSLAPKQIIIQPPPPKKLTNRAVTCKPQTVTIGTQTDGDDLSAGKVVFPIPVCIYVPVPMWMYTAPAPCPIPIPVPMIVPLCIPTDQHAAKMLATLLKEAKESIADHLAQQHCFSDDEDDRQPELDDALSLALQIANTDVFQTDHCIEDLTDTNTCVKIWSQWTKHKTDLLKSSPHELNNSLCSFLCEINKPESRPSSREDILSICLGIQHFISDNQRSDCIFTDEAFSDFTTELKKILGTHQPDSGPPCAIDEQELWANSELGAHSPQVLLDTLVYFNMKYLKMMNFKDHLHISFSQYSIDWVTDGSGGIDLSLQHRLNADSQPKIVKENAEKPLECFVKLFEFFSSRCPESVRQSNAVFYLVPESFCGPGNPAWYTDECLDRESLWKTFVKFCFVKQIHLT